MEDFIAALSDRPNRRQFCASLLATTTVFATGANAASAPAQGFKIIGVNHISYACADYRKARDFYASVLGMENVARADNGHETRLMFGPSKGGSFLIPRNGRTAGKAKAVVDHICYAVAGSDEMRIRAALMAKGITPAGRDAGLHVYDPFDYDVQIKAAGATGGGDAALKATHIDHISYSCPDFKRAADWYSRIFNLEQTGATASEVTLAFGKKGDAMPALIIRTRPAGDATNGSPPRKAKALVNHIAYTIADFEKERVRAELKRLGYANPLQDGEHSFHIVDPNGFDVQISGIEMTALSG